MITRSATRHLFPALVLVMAVSAVGQNVLIPSSAVDIATRYFQEALRDKDRLPVVLAGLRASGDAEVLPLVEALMRSGDREIRLLATASVTKVGGKDSAPALRERLEKDPSMVIRAEALVQLAILDAVAAQQLVEATKIEDEGVQLIAARTLARQGQGTLALPTLQKLAASADSETVAFARMSLLGLGVDEKTQMEELRKVILNPETEEDLLVRLLNQIRQEKIRVALPVAQFLAKPNQSRTVRVRAYMVLADLMPDASQVLAEAIRQSDNAMFQINLMRILSEQEDAQYRLDEFARKQDLVGAVARFELGRRSGGPVAEKATADMLALGHPILVEYALNRMQKDVAEKKDQAAFYAQPMLKILRQEELESDRLTAKHDRMALLVELLGNLGTPEAMAGLRQILSGPDTPTRKLTAGALYRSTNPAVCDLLRPLLTSPFGELKTYAGLTLARHGDPEAAGALLDIQDQAKTQKADVLTLTNWYLLKLSGQSKPAIQRIAQMIR